MTQGCGLFAAILMPVLASSAFSQSLLCTDVFGNPVPVVDAQIPDIGQATIYGGRPVILFNTVYASQFPPNVVTFFLYHECGHHALGHILGAGLPLTNEQAADCWAVRTLVSTGQFDVEDIRVVQIAIARFGRADWTHLPGPMRAMNLEGCLSVSPRGGGPSPRNTSSGGRDRVEPGSPACTVTRGEIDQADISEDFSDAVTSSSIAVVQRALENARSRLRDDLAECWDDLNRLRRHPDDSYWEREVREDKGKTAGMRATIDALEERLGGLQ